MAKKAKLTEKQQRFVDEYLIDLNATQAAIRAGYSVKTANEQGSQNLAKLSIQQAIAEQMAEQIAADAINPTEKILAISHCNCPERAMAVEKLIREKINVKESFIVDTAGISSMYANDGGIIVVL